MALTRGTTGSLWPSFDSARLVSLAVWRAYAIALDERFPTALSPPIARLRYHLGGDRPSQTTHHAGSRTRVHGPRLDISDNKGGISPVAPQELALLFQSLPPILHMLTLIPLQSCSKGARGLSV